MARTTKLTDIQLILLTTAAQRPDGCLLPPAEAIEEQGDRIRKTIPPLIKRALAAEAEVADARQSWRSEGDTHIGVVITDAGRAAVGIETNDIVPPAADEPSNDEVPHDEAPAPAAKLPSKIAQVTALLQRQEGASLAEMVDSTGWLPHTTRAALTGLRKKGHAVVKSNRGGVTIYSIAVAA